MTLFAVVFAFQVRPAWRPGIRTAYLRALVVGLCAAIAVAPVLQRWEWLFPMPGTRSGCEGIGRYEVLRTRAAVAGPPAGSDAAALAYAQENRREEAVADCLASTTTLWLPLYGVGAAVPVGAGAWHRDRSRARRRAGPGSSPQEPPADAGARQADPA
ncbi:hypothetical protein [Streptomyces erythrochromogenes]|uniref:hypothetical protein n=1 Tax=Streptomyces erythrochromogenes TaxID=285574 RepID=UPI00386A58AF|nr:hypothetical protein OG489_00965 [Streptomyces erythrochromogenes]WSR88186.1 hypothetical protein OG489_38995 [Streptomyces erythrochromogenes]